MLIPRRTKIVATLGPATDPIAVLDELIAAGLDVARLNLSHDTHERHRERAERLRARAAAAGREVGLLLDLQGPKIRIGKFRDGPIVLNPGEHFAIDAQCPLDAGDRERCEHDGEREVAGAADGDALAAGASHLVVARPIVAAPDRRAAAEAIVAEIENA